VTGTTNAPSLSSYQNLRCNHALDYGKVQTPNLEGEAE